jgi:hypothetical protein
MNIESQKEKQKKETEKESGRDRGERKTDSEMKGQKQILRKKK